MTLSAEEFANVKGSYEEAAKTVAAALVKFEADTGLHVGDVDVEHASAFQPFLSVSFFVCKQEDA